MLELQPRRVCDRATIIARTLCSKMMHTFWSIVTREMPREFLRPLVANITFVSRGQRTAVAFSTDIYHRPRFNCRERRGEQATCLTRATVVSTLVQYCCTNTFYQWRRLRVPRNTGNHPTSLFCSQMVCIRPLAHNQLVADGLSTWKSLYYERILHSHLVAADLTAPHTAQEGRRAGRVVLVHLST